MKHRSVDFDVEEDPPSFWHWKIYPRGRSDGDRGYEIPDTRVSPIGNSILRWQLISDRAMLLPYGREFVA